MLHAIGYISCIKVSMKFVQGCDEQDCPRCIRAKLLGSLVCALFVAWLYGINVLVIKGLVRWTLKTCLFMIIPLWHQVLHNESEDTLDWTVNARNYLLAPILEEIVFRGPQTGLISSSLAFSLAHCHRVFFNASEWIIFVPQMIITFLFGLYSYHIYSQTKSIATCSVVHVLCNYCGCPQLEHFSCVQAIVVQIVAALLAFFFI